MEVPPRNRAPWARSCVPGSSLSVLPARRGPLSHLATPEQRCLSVRPTTGPSLRTIHLTLAICPDTRGLRNGPTDLRRAVLCCAVLWCCTGTASLAGGAWQRLARRCRVRTAAQIRQQQSLSEHQTRAGVRVSGGQQSAASSHGWLRSAARVSSQPCGSIAERMHGGSALRSHTARSHTAGRVSQRAKRSGWEPPWQAPLPPRSALASNETLASAWCISQAPRGSVPTQRHAGCSGASDPPMCDPSSHLLPAQGGGPLETLLGRDPDPREPDR